MKLEEMKSANFGNTEMIDKRIDHKIHTMDLSMFIPCFRIFVITNTKVNILAKIKTICNFPDIIYLFLNG